MSGRPVLTLVLSVLTWSAACDVPAPEPADKPVPPADCSPPDDTSTPKCSLPECSSSAWCKGRCLTGTTDLGVTFPLTHAAGPGEEKGPAGCAREPGFYSSYLWTAPKDASFVFDIAGSSINASLSAIRLAACDASPNDDCSYPYRRSTSLRLLAGQSVVVFIETDAGDGPGPGHHELHISELAATEHGQCFDLFDQDADGRADCDDADCADTDECGGLACVSADLGASILTSYSADMSKARNRFFGSCSGQSSPEVAYLWKAPYSGDFVIEGQSSFTQSVYVRRGACNGPELACVSSGPMGTADNASVRVTVNAGEELVIFIDGGGDSFPFGHTQPPDLAHARAGLAIRPAVDEVDVGSLCRDGIDNDGDALVDLDDPDCQ